MNISLSPIARRLLCAACCLALLSIGSPVAADTPAFPTPGQPPEESSEENDEDATGDERDEDETGESSDSPEPPEPPEAPEPSEETASGDAPEQDSPPERPQPAEAAPSTQEQPAPPAEPDPPAQQPAAEPADEPDDTDEPDDAPPPSALLRRSIYDQGHWSLGIEGIFSMTSSRVELLREEGRASDTTLFLRLNPSVTVSVADGLHIGLVGGLVSRRVAREEAGSATERAYAVQPLLQYYLSFTPRIASYVQAATGYFRGGSERYVDEDDEHGFHIGERDTRTRGVIMTAGTGVSYRLSAGIQLRFGLSFNALWGRESFQPLTGRELEEELDDRLSTSTFNFGTTAGLRYTF